MAMTGLSLSDDKSPLFIRLTVTFLVLSTLSTALRLWSRLITRNLGFGNDDWLCFIAAINVVAVCILGIVWAHNGLGQHIVALPPDQITTGLKIYMAAAIVYTAAIQLVKSSALCLYHRIFGKMNPRFNIAIYVGQFLVYSRLVWAVFTTVFNCTPVAKFWQPDLPGTCINTYAWFLATGVLDALTDLYVLCLPMPMLWRLQMKTSRKWFIAGAFLCGYGSLVATLGRLISVGLLGSALNEDFTWNGVEVMLWAFAEPSAGLISICLPSVFHLVRRAIRHGPAALFSAKAISEATSSTNPAMGKRQSRPLSYQGAVNGDSNVRSLGHDEEVAMRDIRGEWMKNSHTDDSPYYVARNSIEAGPPGRAL